MITFKNALLIASAPSAISINSCSFICKFKLNNPSQRQLNINSKSFSFSLEYAANPNG